MGVGGAVAFFCGGGASATRVGADAEAAGAYRGRLCERVRLAEGTVCLALPAVAGRGSGIEGELRTWQRGRDKLGRGERQRTSRDQSTRAPYFCGRWGRSGRRIAGCAVKTARFRPRGSLVSSDCGSRPPRAIQGSPGAFNHYLPESSGLILRARVGCQLRNFSRSYTAARTGDDATLCICDARCCVNLNCAARNPVSLHRVVDCSIPLT